MIPIKPNNVTWTDEQWEAIYEDNRNIIVSAGAGSGKTAVLTERVIRKLKDGIDVNRLLILTFTKAAAGEMANRIRKKIKKIPELKEQLNLLDSAYITTFDSFALSIVKKYHYLLNVSNNIGIIDSSIIDLQKNKIMDELFLEYYQKKDPQFLELIKTFCTKDDNEIRNYILNISNKLDLLSNKEEYLNNYLTNFYQDNKIEQDIDKYLNLIKSKIQLIKEKIEEIGFLDAEFSIKIQESLEGLFNFTSYDELVTNLNIKLPIAPRGSADELKNLKSEISDLVKEIKDYAIYQDITEIRNSITSTYSIVKTIIELILEFTKRVMKYKQENNSYEFNDIAILAIKVVKENAEVREELKNYFCEIMIDEYQDTNDLQEEFIQMIANNNTYMVGDIKQSIYRFRNANPYIFKNKYDNYSNSTKDLKIDLNKNFRSRSEVLDNINTIFTLIMDDEIGGADYLTSHQMIFGNQAYLKETLEHSNDMEVYQYSFDKSLGFTKEETEAFMIAKDIQEKYKNKHQVFDKDTGLLRDIKYQDFSIIMDRATNFDLYKKVFNYFQIPLTLLKDEKMNDEADIHIISNLIRFTILIKEKNYNTEFKYLFTSLMRSFLFETNDELIFDYFNNKNFEQSSLYQKCAEIAKILDYSSIHQILERFIIDLDYYEKYIKIGNIRSGITKISKLMELSTNLENLGYDIYMFSDYLSELLKIGYKMEYKVPDTGADAVKIMTIHKSKGLEYPICYFSGLYKEFNISDLKEKFLVDKDFGIITPYFNEGISQTIYKELLKDKYLKEEISEKIRLFYVALTRAREKMILIKPTNEKNDYYTNATVLKNTIKQEYRSLADILDSVEFKIKSKYKTINVEDLKLTKDYSFSLDTNIDDTITKTTKKIKVDEINITRKEKENLSFSKKTNELIDKKTKEAMELGNNLHEYLEYFDFKNPNLDYIDNKFILDIIKDLIENPLLKNINQATIYQEYEFIYENDNKEYHGIIDLMLEYPDYIDLIDYKLKNTTDKAYKEQLLGYYNYLKTKTNKKINLYLYSLLERKFYQINL